MKLYYIGVIICLASCFSQAQQIQKVVILPESKITLSGVSNINTFTCELCEDSLLTELNFCYATQNEELVFDDHLYQIPVSDFICNTKFITQDLQKTLKAETYPYLYLQLKNIKKDGVDNKAALAITIAGVTNEYWLKYELQSISGEQYQIHVDAKIDIGDFNINPPTALMGLIKVEEIIYISLDLILEFKGN